jgi:energy-coupling factor transporter ATP-binding protein EcfA2
MKIVGITGKQGSGKTTLSNSLKKQLEEAGAIVKQFKFATPIYHLQEILKRTWAPYWGIKMEEKEGRLLQLIGTDWGRETKGPNIWVDAMRHKLGGEQEATHIIIDDTRFPNEVEMLESFGATIVRLDAPASARKPRTDSWREGYHESEVALDDFTFEHTFNTKHLTAEGVTHEVLKLLETS